MYETTEYTQEVTLGIDAGYQTVGFTASTIIEEFKLRTRDSEFGVRNSGFGIRGSGFGIRDSGFGIRNSGFGIREEGVRGTLNYRPHEGPDRPKP